MKYYVDLAILSLLFFMWGFITCLNDILIPHLKNLFDLTYLQAALVQFTFFSAYFILALPSGRIAARWGYQRAMVVGLLVAGLGAVGFIPAAYLMSYGVFLLSLFTLAAGITVLQVAANPYVTIIGPEATAASRLNLTQAFNSLGTTLAPIFGGMLILGATAKATAVVGPYLLLAALLCALAVGIGLYQFPTPSVASKDDAVPLKEIWRYRHTVLGAVAIFLYVGAEVSIGSFLVNYLSGSDMLGLDHESAAGYVALYWGGAMVGRFIGAAAMQRVSVHHLMAGCTLGAVALVLLSVSTSGALSCYAILAVGCCNSIMFPSLFSMGIAKLGRLTSAGSSLLVMAIVGGALVPVAMGWMADQFSLKFAFYLPVICYFYLFYYSLWGSRVLNSRAP